MVKTNQILQIIKSDIATEQQLDLSVSPVEVATEVKSKKVLLPTPSHSDVEPEAIAGQSPDNRRSKVKVTAKRKSKKKSKKVLPPIPPRSDAEREAIARKYGKYQQQSTLPILELIPTTLIDLIRVELKSPDARVAANVAQNSIEQEIDPVIAKQMIAELTSVLLANPELIVPSWSVLIDHNLPIRQKFLTLLTVGWTALDMPPDRHPKSGYFLRIYLLARLLEQAMGESQSSI